MIASWLAQMNQRERILALAVGGILFLLINLAIWSALFGMSAGARADYATRRATRTEQTVYLGEEKIWRRRADWLKKNQPTSNDPAEASSLLTQVKRSRTNTKSRSKIRKSAPWKQRPRTSRFRPRLKPVAAGNRSSVSFMTPKAGGLYGPRKSELDG